MPYIWVQNFERFGALYFRTEGVFMKQEKKCWKTTKGIVKNTEDKFTLLFQDLVHFVRRS